MGKDAARRIAAAARSLFSRNHYEAVSIAQVCKAAGVAKGLFYHYYDSKESIVRELLEEMFVDFTQDLAAVDGSTVSERLASFVGIAWDAIHRYADRVTMFREGQYRIPELERRLRGVYADSVSSILGRPATEAEYVYAVAGLRFLATRSLYHNLSIDVSVLTRMVERGIFPGTGTEAPLPIDSPALASEEPGDTKTAILEAGMRLFGERGYFDVQVSDIVRSLGLSVGTFYNHFESKEGFLSEAVDRIGHLTRRYLATHAPDSGTPIDRELAGLWNFVSYYARNPWYYSILREAEFVVPQAVHDYYDAFERGHARSLAIDGDHDRIVAANLLMGIAHYLGIEMLFSDRVDDPKALFERLGSLLGSGIAGPS